MGATSGIQWCTATWNPHYGCRKVSQGCAKCYAERQMTQYGKDFKTVRRAAASTFNAPLRWQRAWARGERDPQKALAPGSRIFTCSWSDWFIEEADEWRAEAWEIVRWTPQYNYLILTKRPERIAAHLPAGWGAGWPNVWLGVSAEREAEANQRVGRLLDIPAAVHFISAEPLLGPIDLTPWLPEKGRRGYVDWVITGGESDREHPRPCNMDWVRDLRDQCLEANPPVAFFHKQNGGSRKVDGAWGGRLLDGRTWDEFPAVDALA